VGGEISSIVIHQMKEFGRISVCGCISSYNTGLDWNNISLEKATFVQKAIIFRQLKMEGFIVYRWKNRWNEGSEKNLAWIREGKLIYKETVTEGFENIFKAFTGMLKGSNIGKAIVKV
jgi:prostaglandin reductase 1